MTPKQILSRPSWRRIRSFAKAQAVAPASIGVYVIGETARVLDLPTGLRWVYIGKTKNVRRRLAEHTDVTEKNKKLRNWLANTNHKKIEIWYTIAKTLREAEKLEEELVKKIKPFCNTQHTQEKKSHAKRR